MNRFARFHIGREFNHFVKPNRHSKLNTHSYSITESELFTSYTNLTNHNLARSLVMKQSNKPTENDYQDLLAQARTDKTMERALLRMLINASLRTSMNGAQSQTLNPNYYNGADNSDNWQEIKGTDSFVRNGFNGLQGSGYPQMSSRLGRMIDDYAGADPVSGDLGQSLQMQDQFQSVVDKREYIKPCSFNAISCAKNPFRKL